MDNVLDVMKLVVQKKTKFVQIRISRKCSVASPPQSIFLFAFI